MHQVSTWWQLVAASDQAMLEKIFRFFGVPLLTN
jgi:hypothetical protein